MSDSKPRNRKPGRHRPAFFAVPAKAITAVEGGYRYQSRLSPSKRGYGRDWQRLRDFYLTRHPVCEIQHKCNGAAASEVDHVEPFQDGGERLDEHNLQAACGPCHSWKTAAIDMKQRRQNNG